MRSGIKTTEFWVTLASQLVGLLVFLGMVPLADHKQVETVIVSTITSLSVVICNVLSAYGYVKSRTMVKVSQLEQEKKPLDLTKIQSSANGLLPFFLLAGLGALCLAGPGRAEEPKGGKSPCWSILPWRQEVERRLERERERQRDEGKTDPAMARVLQQLADNQALMLKILEKGQAPLPAVPSPPIALAPQAPREIHHYYYGPKQQLPIEGAPKQQLPIEGAPKQQLPIEQAPKQGLPIEQAPKQGLPIEGAPKQGLEGRPPAPNPGAPISYQRFTTAPAEKFFRPVAAPVVD